MVIDELSRLIDTLLKVEALHAGATTEGERLAAESAMERIKAKLRQFELSDPPVEIKFTLVNRWSKQLFSALARRYGLTPYRYYRQRYTTVMLRAPSRFINEVLWPEFEALDKILEKHLDEVANKIISQAIFSGNNDVEIRDQSLIESDVETKDQTKSAIPPPHTPTQTAPAKPVVAAKSSQQVPLNVPIKNAKIKPDLKHVSRNSPCPCGSGKKYKRCCGLKKKLGR
jgi:hypothetical protein